VPFVVAGYPTIEASLEMLLGFARQGALVAEIGVPFSDPIADGPDIQRASEHALARGAGVDQALRLIESLRRQSELPVVLMSYTNPVMRGGIERFADKARAAGADGVLLSDLPPDEAPEVWKAIERSGLDTVMLVAPTSDQRRVELVVRRARGFVYCLARTGVTGTGPGYSGSIPERVAAVRRLTALPVAVGFGVSSAGQARALRGVADAVVVGAAFVRAAAAGDERGAAERVLALSGELIDVLG
jgi:tryptophan synthase alpha chain